MTLVHVTMESVTAGVPQLWRDRERLRDLVIDANDGIVAIALLDEERRQLLRSPDQELDELAAFYEAKGLAPKLARTVAIELTTAADALAAHAEEEHGSKSPKHNHRRWRPRSRRHWYSQWAPRWLA